MGKDVEVHVAISCENITLFNKYYAVNSIRLCIRGLAFLGKGSMYLPELTLESRAYMYILTDVYSNSNYVSSISTSISTT